MKKVFTLMLALFAMVAVQAQSLLSEDFENGIPATWLNIDADNDSYAWMEGTAPGVSGHNGSNGCAYSCSYYDGVVLTPDNWLITPAVTLTGNSDLTFWVAAQDASYAAEHYGVYISTTGTATSNFTLLFEETINANGGAKVQGTWKQKTISLANYTGQTVYIAFRHFNCTDMFYFNLDDVEITAQPTGPTISANPTTINFGTIAIGSDQTQTVNVTNYNLTTGVTATTTAPFSVSADGNTFGTTATIAAAGGTLYVQYAPTAVGTNNGTVTLSSTGATDVTITLAGSAIDCGNITIPFIEGFENGIVCWTMISMDPANDEEFGVFEDADAYEGTHDFQFSSYASASDYNQYLITPQLTLNATDDYLLKFFYQGYNSGDAFKVLYSTTNNNLSSFIELADYPTVATSWTEVVLELPSNTKYVAIDYYGNYKYYLYIDNFSITTVSSSMTLSETALDFGINEMGTISSTQYVVMNTISVNEPFTVTTAAPFEVSLDGVNFAATQTIPANTATVVYDTIFVRFAPTTAGTFNESMTVSSTSYNSTVALTGESVDCTPGITVPYTQDFNANLVPPVCWAIGYDPEIFMSLQVDETDYCIGMEGVDMLISPEIHATSPLLVSFDYINYAGTSATTPTYFHVGYSTTDNIPSSFTWQGEQLCSTDAFESYSTVIPAGTKYVAIGASQIGTFLYYGLFEMEDIFVIDNFSLTAQTDALLTVSPESMSFGSIIYGSSTPVQTASVVGALLTSDINVTAPANFEVSANGTSYAATATLPQDGGTLYVRYNPSAPGNHTGTITVTSGTASKTISVFGSAMDCSNANALPYFDGFEDGIGACYRNIDNDGDGYAWVDNIYSEWAYEPYDGEGCAMSASYINNIGALNPDNYLITPALIIPSQGAKVSWYVAAQDPSYAAETYDVLVSTTPDNLNSFTSIFNETLASGDWEMRTANIPSNFNGQNVYVAFRHHDVTDMFWMKIDNLSVTAGTGVENHELNTTIFPNPANNVLNINANSNINRVEVYNMMGQMVGSYNVNDVNTQISTTALANGVYTVRISTENGMSTKKFTVAR